MEVCTHTSTDRSSQPAHFAFSVGTRMWTSTLAVTNHHQCISSVHCYILRARYLYRKFTTQYAVGSVQPRSREATLGCIAICGTAIIDRLAGSSAGPLPVAVLRTGSCRSRYYVLPTAQTSPTFLFHPACFTVHTQTAGAPCVVWAVLRHGRIGRATEQTHPSTHPLVPLRTMDRPRRLKHAGLTGLVSLLCQPSSQADGPSPFRFQKHQSAQQLDDRPTPFTAEHIHPPAPSCGAPSSCFINQHGQLLAHVRLKTVVADAPCCLAPGVVHPAIPLHSTTYEHHHTPTFYPSSLAAASRRRARPTDEMSLHR